MMRLFTHVLAVYIHSYNFHPIKILKSFVIFLVVGISPFLVGLEHFTDLNTPVTRREAEKIYSIVKTEAERILPGVTVIMTGGFIR